MTESEKAIKTLRKDEIEKKLLELKRKIDICADMLLKAQTCHRLYKNEYERLDRELFEEDPGITIVRTKKEQKPVADVKTLLFNYDKLNREEQEMMMAKLLDIQTIQRADNAQKTQM